MGAARGGFVIASAVTAVMGITNLESIPWAGGILLGFAAVLGIVSTRVKPPAAPTPEQELARRADGIASQLKAQANRLHRALHPAVADTLDACAGYWLRIRSALDLPGWQGSDVPAHWTALRNEALLAANAAMDEALVHAGTTLNHVPPARPLEQISDALEDVGFGPLVGDRRGYEPMPATFTPVRDLAERLRELAERCETASHQRRVEAPEPISPAFRRLDAALGEMRNLEEAEGELRQNA